jgi:hypothetical protein
LAANLRHAVDDMRAQVEQAEFEHLKQAHRPGSHDDDIGIDHLYFPASLRVDTVPVPRSFTLTARNAAVLDHDQTG